MSDNEQEKSEEKSPVKPDSEEEERSESPEEDLFQDRDESTTTPPPTESEPTGDENGDSSTLQQKAPTINDTNEEPAVRPSDPRLAVPRKSPSAPPASDPRSPSSLLHHGDTGGEQNQPPTRPGYPGPSVGLPEGITVPNGVDSKLLQGRLLDALLQLPNDLITDALNEYDDALQNKGGSIRNQGAYLYGVIKRYINVQERAASGNAEHVMGKTLTPEVTVSVNEPFVHLSAT